MKQWTIGKRVTIGFSAVIIVMVALSIFTLCQTSIVRKQFSVVSDRAVPALQHIKEVQSRAEIILGCVYKHIYSHSAADMAKLEEIMAAHAARNVEDLAAYQKLIATEKEQALYQEVQTARDQYLSLRNEILKASRATTNAEASDQVCTRARADLDPLVAKYTDALARLAEEETKAVADSSTTTAGTIRNCNLGVLLGTTGALLLGVGLAFFIIRAVNQALKQVGTTLDEASSQVAAAATQVSAASQSLAEGASEQAASLEETSSSLEEMASMTQRNAEHAQKANDLTRQARSAADTGATDMQAMNQAMQDIKASSDEIGKIIKTIDEIAFQTNILALNAAVEAARAGEAGMGFAVVADEVRNLAQRCAQSAKETADKIEGAITKTAQGVQLSAKVTQGLQTIVAKVRQVDELVAEVAGASKEQSQGISQVNTAVTQMDKVTQSNAANAEESASAAEELNAQAESLKEAVGQLMRLVGGQATTQSSPATERQPSLAPTKATAPAKAALRPQPRNNGNGHSLVQPQAEPALTGVGARRGGELPLPGDFKDF